MASEWQKRRQAAIEALDKALREQASAQTLDALRAEIEALELVNQHTPVSGWRRHMFTAFAVGSLLIASALWLLPYPNNQFSAKLNAARVTATLLEDSKILLETPIRRLRIVGDTRLESRGIAVPKSSNELQLTTQGTGLQLHALRISSGSVISLSINHQRLNLTIRTDTGAQQPALSGSVSLPAGSRLRADRRPGVQLGTDMKIPETLSFENTAGSELLTLSLDLVGPHQLVLPVSVSNVSFLHRAGATSAQPRQSAIHQGTLNLPDQEKSVALLPGTLLDIEGTGTLLVSATQDNVLKLHYLGVAQHLATRFMDIETSHGMNTLVAVSKNQQLLLFWSALVFVWVLLNGIRDFVRR